MSGQVEAWFENIYNKVKEWQERPEVRSAIAKTGLAIGVLGFVLYSLYKEESNPDDQIQAIAERLIAAGQGFLMPS